MQNTMLFFDGERYRLLEWCVMPNHVHALILPIKGYLTAKIVHSWKSIRDMRLKNSLIRQNRFGWLNITIGLFETTGIWRLFGIISDRILLPLDLSVTLRTGHGAAQILEMQPLGARAARPRKVTNA